ncbi:MAG: alanine--tRNA ligase [Bacilli bacterium]|jgi:alanyl-tRNA synthetase|nr:alanine--tRNA ligase [Bacilli bacterium]
MRNMTSDEIRDTWLNFFKDHGHYIEPSASLIPNNDPTLLWINAGVAALKKYFDGTLTPKHRRITNAQKCIRTNDIDNVGHTARHHTFFEMLGNFSIGDYFRPEVIPWAYDLLTNPKNFGLDKDRLYITYYPDDMDTLNLWVKCGMDPKNMVPCKNNFWEIGEGPCGPDTEINYDRGEKWDPQGLGVKLVQDDLENDRYIELWNIVFSQFNSEPGKPRSEYKPLPQKNIDTGAGLERIACIMQGTDTNFETDLFMPYINEIAKRSKVPYEGKNRLAYRVIADHIRSITFALADGAVFSNDGRGYVLKRLLRRASRYAQTIGLDAGSLSDLVPLVVSNMAHYYPYLSEHEDRTIKMIKNEEDKFASTLKNGEKLLANYLDKPGTVLSGEDAFRLADTYGFPYELTKEITEDAGKKVDEDSYTKLLNDSKELARKSRGDRQSFGLQSKDLIAFTTPSEFVYDDGKVDGKVTGIFVNGVKTDSLDEEGDVAFDKTNFYAEMGGEVADTGFVKNAAFEGEVTNVIPANHGQHLLHVKVLYGALKVGDILTETPDFDKRALIRKNHSATHLLQKALQEIVSPDLHQEGAYYDSENLRLDFNSDNKLSADQLNQIERRVNEKIFAALPVSVTLMPKEEALKLNAMHLFSEKYGDVVRVVKMGEYSTEFCGGLHVSNTADINLFVIVSEGAVSAGIRRITAYTGLKAYDYLKEKQSMINEAADLLSLNSDKGVRQKLMSLNDQMADLNSTIKALREESTTNLMGSLEDKIETVNGKELLALTLKSMTHEQEDSLAHKLIDKHPSLVLFLAFDNGEKKDLVVAVGKNNAGLKAGVLMKSLAQILLGSGGGRPDCAFGGTKDLSHFDDAKKALVGYLK